MKTKVKVTGDFLQSSFERISTLNLGWYLPESLPPTNSILREIRSLRGKIQEINCDSVFVPGTDGSVSLDWIDSNKEFSLELHPDDSLSFWPQEIGTDLLEQ